MNSVPKSAKTISVLLFILAFMYVVGTFMYLAMMLVIDHGFTSVGSLPFLSFRDFQFLRYLPLLSLIYITLSVFLFYTAMKVRQASPKSLGMAYTAVIAVIINFFLSGYILSLLLSSLNSLVKI